MPRFTGITIIKEITDLLWHSDTYYQAISQSLGILKEKLPIITKK
jgi:hypothetical protein